MGVYTIVVPHYELERQPEFHNFDVACNLLSYIIYRNRHKFFTIVPSVIYVIVTRKFHDDICKDIRLRATYRFGNSVCLSYFFCARYTWSSTRAVLFEIYFKLIGGYPRTHTAEVTLGKHGYKLIKAC